MSKSVHFVASILTVASQWDPAALYQFVFIFSPDDFEQYVYFREAVSKRHRLKLQGLDSSDPVCGLIKTIPAKRKRGKSHILVT